MSERGVGAVDWEALEEAAVAAMRAAYAPYSRYPVGAAALARGPGGARIVSGCNVENASYGLTLCAECGLVSELARTGGGRLLAVCCVDGGGSAVMPCGRCRQLLYEFGGAECLIRTPQGVRTLTEIPPQPFGPDDLAIPREGGGGDHGSLPSTR